MPQPSRRDAAPTPAELYVWRTVVAPAHALGTYRWQPARGDGTVGFFYYDEPPALCWCPPGEAVRFSYAAPDRWRLETAGGLLAVTDGRDAFATEESGLVRRSSSLLLLRGPDALLMPRQVRDYRDDDEEVVIARAKTGTVRPDRLLGRACWRWTGQDGTWWLDAATGVPLRAETPEAVLELTALDLRTVPDPAAFTPPPDWAAGAVAVEQPSWDDDPAPEPAQAPVEPGRSVVEQLGPVTAPSAPFTITWWPEGLSGRPLPREDGGALVQLDTDSPTSRFWLGVAPAGQPAPALDPEDDDVQVHRWDGDGCSFALSWQDRLSPADLAALVASVPRTWP